VGGASSAASLSVVRYSALQGFGRQISYARASHALLQTGPLVMPRLPQVWLRFRPGRPRAGGCGGGCPALRRCGGSPARCIRAARKFCDCHLGACGSTSVDAADQADCGRKRRARRPQRQQLTQRTNSLGRPTGDRNRHDSRAAGTCAARDCPVGLAVGSGGRGPCRSAGRLQR
jgi:hypothetical protein